MKKHQIILAFFAVFAFSAVLATSASAEETLLAEWLNNGVAVTGKLLVESKGELELTDLGVPGGASTVLCDGTLDGWVFENGEDEITEVLDLEAKKITNLVEPGVLCTRVAGSCEASTDIEVWPDNLPWLTLLVLMTTEPFFLIWLFKDASDPGTGQPGWETLCLVLGLNVEDLCEGLTSAAAENVAGGVLALFNEEAPISSEKGTCTLGGAGTGDIKGEGLIALVEGGPLTVSSVG